MKKIITLILCILSIFLTSCTQPNGIQLPNLENKTREQIAQILEEKNIKYTFKFSQNIIESSVDLDMFVSYGNDLKAGDYISPDKQVVVYTTVLPLTESYAQKLKMDFDYEGKSFVNDGIGEVTLVRSIDGDTAHFRDNVTNEYIKVRFLGINTPESTIEKDAWGKAAAEYTAYRLKNAKHIVLEAEGAGSDIYERELAFVWVDGVLLNLEIIDLAYSTSKLSVSSSKYGQIFLEASIAAKKTGRRVYGEIDPNYDYENKKFK